MEYEYNLVAAKGLPIAKRISYLTVVTNETMMNGQRQRQMKKRKEKKSRGDGRTPTSRGGHAMLHVVKLPTASAAQHYCPHGCVCCVHVCTGHVLYTACCLSVARRE